MMRKTTTTALLLGILLASGSATAQSLRNADQPAEFPPPSFAGKQYVDSKGCVFVRAGFDGNVTWVPRVNRQRNVICGFQPSFAKAPVPSAPVVPDTQVATNTTTIPAPVVAERPAAVPRPPVSARPAPPPTTTATPKRVVTAPVVRTQPVVRIPGQVVTTGACPGVSAASAPYIGNGQVRCGPQAVHPGTYSVARVNPGPEIKPPPGYKNAFEGQDRFNPNRGKQTKEGFDQMRLVWTSGVPRRLVDQNTGRDVTSLFPGLRFPFINLTQQKRYVKTHGWPATSGNDRAVDVGAASSVTVATKNTPPTRVVTPRPAVSNGHRYVQVGTYGVQNNANNAAAALQRMGLPVRLGTYKKSGKTYRIVLAGPFGDSGSLSNALTAARRAGFSDAFTRK